MTKNKLNIAILSHSNVHTRQIWFWRDFAYFCNVLVISPKKWGNMECEDFKTVNFEIFTDNVLNKERGMSGFLFSKRVFNKIKSFKPDIIYNQDEVWCHQSKVNLGWARKLKCKFVQFCWDNLNVPTSEDKVFLNKCDFIICGNYDSIKLHGGNFRLPQVGVDTNFFRPFNGIDKDLDVLFLGRKVKEKGVEYIKRAFNNTFFVSDIKYYDVPSVMNRAKIFVSYPYNISWWKEQFASYTNIEAMSCGVPVITSDCGSISEWLDGSLVPLIPQRSVSSLRSAILNVLKDDNLRIRMSKFNREFVINNFSYEVVMKKLLGVFNDVVKA